MKNTLVIYHGPNCTDGFTSAWAFWKVFGDDIADYFPQMHEPNNAHRPPDLSGYSKVIVVDFSYPRAVLLEMHEELARRGAELFVIDHHETARADCEGLPFCAFDMNRSGAGLAWDMGPVNGIEHGFRERRPKLVDYVEDADLWRFALPHSKEIRSYIETCPKTFARWDDLAIELARPDDFQRAVYAGSCVLAAKELNVEKCAREARYMLVRGLNVPVVNCPYFLASEVAGKLAEDPDEFFAVAWFQQKSGDYYYSLRSKHGFDVSEVAKALGGGGHAAAAGFVHPKSPGELFGGAK